ncbi:Glycosyltransferase, GT2 family [Maribacter dokdonensis]|uniref:Glycosyltransferase, GT2 family n=1 Tax=Maribacter dokdonensis TaxID=320912 RepID=A0ABY0UIW6_9FLAO|nr:glycosyltransferase [Maribacter dokdonensis]SDS73440.1 Glycosyltransferase, GT2 family [Maribacter dokdonensis]
MTHIAVLYTSHNRKTKTLRSLASINEAWSTFNKSLQITIYLTDDGSTDGTSEAIRKEFPEVNILQGNGNLFWAGGMINSWKEAIKKKYDGYLLLNDDTFICKNIFDDIILTDEYASKTFMTKGVYIGSTKDPETDKLTYGGAVLTNKLLYQFTILQPNGEFQQCDLGNANIMYVASEVVDKVGILSPGYVHGIADYDYTLKCKKNNIPVLVMPNYCGFCERDTKGLYHSFHLMTFKERLKHLYSPTGIAFKSRLLFMRKFFPYRYPMFYIMGWLKVLFPKVYLKARHGK